MNQSCIDKLNVELPVFWELLPLADWREVYSAYRNFLLQKMDEADADIMLNEIVERRISNIPAASPSLDVLAEILKHSLWGTENSILVKRSNYQKVSSDIENAKQELLRRQKYNEWPEINLSGVWNTIPQNQRFEIELNDIDVKRHSVIILPLVLASMCVNGKGKSFLGKATAIFKLKRLKTFDENWFNTVIQQALACLLQQTE
jgi:hypothetical protein